jgi:hypothetical protein
MPITVAIEGEPASFHDIAGRQFFGEAESVKLVCCDTFAATFQQALQELAQLDCKVVVLGS